MNNSELFENFRKACNDYLHAFCLKHDFDFEDAKSSWVCDIPGTYVLVGDYSVSMETIITDIDENIPEEMFLIWYDWSLGDGNNMSYRTWLKTVKGLIENVYINQDKLSESCVNLKKAIKNFKNSVNEGKNKNVECIQDWKDGLIEVIEKYK